MLSVKEESPRQPEVEEMIRQADAFAEALYPPESRYPFDIEALCQPKVRFFVARLSGKAVGCGALVMGKEGKAEIKRMFVSQKARGHGVGRVILEEIEILAREKGVNRIRLETGNSSHAALSLYRSCGYRERGPFGAYQADQWTVFMEKKLTPT